MKYLLLISCFFISMQASAQTTPSDYVEGGKVVLEFAKLFKSSNDSEVTNDCNSLNLGDIEFINKLRSKLTITILDKTENKELYNVVIPKKQSEQLFDIPVNVYHCIVVKNESGEVIQKGDIKLKKCKTLTVKIVE